MLQFCGETDTKERNLKECTETSKHMQFYCEEIWSMKIVTEDAPQQWRLKGGDFALRKITSCIVQCKLVISSH